MLPKCLSHTKAYVSGKDLDCLVVATLLLIYLQPLSLPLENEAN